MNRRALMGALIVAAAWVAYAYWRAHHSDFPFGWWLKRWATGLHNGDMGPVDPSAVVVWGSIAAGAVIIPRL